ncbi:MAG: pantetheine-phosphate adenylyltransferase [Acidobacteria bacterium]|nr:pantetheine-phosphate adenylyltransferase [Acidobacteriota bacterium]
MAVLAIYPGSFDPVTYGHLDIIERAQQIFDQLTVAVLVNVEKNALFSLEERMEMLRESTRQWSHVTIDSFHGLLVEYALRRNARVILRGIRAVSDYEYEFQMALMNRRLQPRIETVFMMPAEAYSFLSSRLVKEVCGLGGDVSEFVPPQVAERLKRKLS